MREARLFLRPTFEVWKVGEGVAEADDGVKAIAWFLDVLS